MDYVQVFNDELQSVLMTKPSISKAKMVQITRAAIKGIKFYKHIVQTVEKFISRCRPEYMISGLYVIDSIVRQSRHQFGPDRDVYTPRFAKNICITFETLFSNCLPDDKPKIVRVLNLWLKNGVFDPQTIQPLMELASTTTSRMFPKSPDANPEILGHSSKYSNQTSTNSLRFSKDLLDFDYDEDDGNDGDETPTEAEPLLSSTLAKIKSKPQRSPSPRPDGFSSQQSDLDPAPTWINLITQDPSKIENASQPERNRSRSRSPTTASSQPFDTSKQTSIPDHRIADSKESTSTQSSQARQAQRAADRKRRCLPGIRDKHLTVCSCTLWLGHVPKSVSERDITEAFEDYGTIDSIDLVPPRGCAYVCMKQREDAKKILDKAKGFKLRSNHIKMAWAPGKGFQNHKKLKDFWESDVGASFIPYSRVDETIDFEALEEGGLIDEDSMSMEMQERRKEQEKEKQFKKDTLTQPVIPPPQIALLNQPPSYSSSLNVPAPSIGQGLIPFPPPSVMATSTGEQVNLPPPSSLMLGRNLNPPVSEAEGSAPSIEQQLNMTERQISIVEQQLNMIQQAQGGRNLPIQSIPHMQTMPQGPYQNFSQPNAMMFDMNFDQHMLQTAHSMIDPSLAMFANNPPGPITPYQMMAPTNFNIDPSMFTLNESFDHQRGF